MLSPFAIVPAFPECSGPHIVGSADVEVPVSQLSSPVAPPDSRSSSFSLSEGPISTLSFRIYYPCERPIHPPKPLYWVCEPQREYGAGFARFLGANPILSEVIAAVPNIFYYTTINALRDAPLAKPTTPSNTWPVLVFSHGLGGTRNAYSHLCCSLASHGIVVLAPEHRDGSAPLSVINDEDGRPLERIEYLPIAHESTQEVQDARNAQLKIRLWELGLLHDAILKLDMGEMLTNYAAAAEKSQEASESVLAMFRSMLDVNRPGSISWAGHSFGAVTVNQLVKSAYYACDETAPSSYEPVFSPPRDSAIADQITPATTVILLDMWGLPLLNEKTRWLYEKPLPGYFLENGSNPNILAVISEGFYKWNANLIAVKNAVSADPSPWTPRKDSVKGPYLFYVERSAHLSQSDFGVLFPWVNRIAASVDDSERVMRLNVRACLEVMRRSGAHLADTSADDLELSELVEHRSSAYHDDKPILHPHCEEHILCMEECVRGWIPLRLDREDLVGEGCNVKTPIAEEPVQLEISKIKSPAVVAV